MNKKGFLYESGVLALIFVSMVFFAWPGYAQVSKPIATSDGDNPGLRVEVHELKRTGDGMLTLKFVMINDSDEEADIEDQFKNHSWSRDREDVSGVHLIDGANKKEYLVVKDSEDNCVCSRNLKRKFEGKSRMNLWAKFPAPPEEVKKITIVIPHFIPMDGVAIGQ